MVENAYFNLNKIVEILNNTLIQYALSAIYQFIDQSHDKGRRI